MGADLAVAMIPLCKTQVEALAKLHTIDKKDLVMAVDHLLPGDSEDGDVDEAIRIVTECLDAVYSYVEYGSRDTALCRWGSRTFLVTGGMTWGDDPTDAYQPVSIVESLELTWDEDDL